MKQIAYTVCNPAKGGEYVELKVLNDYQIIIEADHGSEEFIEDNDYTGYVEYVDGAGEDNFYYLERMEIEPYPGPPPGPGIWIHGPTIVDDPTFYYKTAEPEDEPFALISLDAHEECGTLDTNINCEFTHKVEFFGTQGEAEAQLEKEGASNMYIAQILKKQQFI